MEKYKCPHCRGNSIKAGKTKNGDQRYRCKSCYKYHKDSYLYRAWQADINHWLLGLLKENCGINGMMRLLRVSKSTIISRLKSLSSIVKKPFVFLGHIYEVDELRTFVGSKQRPVWVTYALDRVTRQIVDLRVGRRNKKTVGYVVKTLLLGNAKSIYTDGLNLYKYLIPVDIHKLSRYGTNRIERKNLDLRTHLKRLNRRSISFSKSILMLEASLQLYFWS